MAEGNEPRGQYVDAEDILGHSADGNEGDSGAESESETETEGSETETDTESETESESEGESGSETESESESGPDGVLSPKQPTATEDKEGSDGQPLPPISGGSRPASPLQQVPTADGDAEAADPEVSLQRLPSGEGLSSTGPTQQEEEREEGDEHDGQGEEEGGAADEGTDQLLEQEDEEQEDKEEYGGQREPQAPQLVLPPVEGSRPSSSQPAGSLAGDGTASEAVPLSLPPATSSRNSSRECSRRGSQLEPTSTGSVLGQSSDSLPPIKAPSPSSQPSKKPSMASSHATSKQSRAMSSRQGSPTRNPIAAPRYYKPPPPPPPPPKPKPREKHDTSAVDPLFLQTAVYRTVPGVGRVYDWQLQHDVNAALSKQRKQQAQMEKVLEAARVTLHVRDANERAFQQWVAAKETEKQQQKQQSRRIAYVTSVYTNLVKDDPVERRTRESLWVNNFPYPTSDNIPARIMVRGNLTDGDERFRI